MHLLLVCDEKDRDSIVGKIKAVSSRKYNIEKGITISSTATSRTTRGHVPLSASVATADEKEREDAIPLSASVATIDEKEREDAIPLSDTETEGKKEKKKYNSLWTQKFGKSEIKDENYLNNTIEYIRNNRIKHELPKSKEIEKIKKEFLCSKEYAHRAEYKGGFDVVIGNPPYVVVSSSDIFSHYYSNNYKVSKGGKTNLYKLFFELSIGLIKNNISKLGFITPSNYLTSNDSLETRNFILKNVKIDCIVEYPEKENVFKNVTQAVAIITLSKPILKKYTFNYTKEQFEDIINISKILKNKRKLIKGENITIKKINSFKNKFDDFIEGYQGEINVSTKKEHFIFEKNESNLQLIRGNHISRYLQKEEINEFCPITISNRKHHLIERIIFQEVSNSGINRRINALIKTNILCGHTTNYVFSKLSEINNKQLLLILNSKLVNYYFKFYNMTNHVPIGEIKSIPLPSISSINSCDFNSKADKMLSLNKRLQEKKNKFLNRIKDNFEIEKISKKVDVFYEYDFKTFVTELKKQKIKFLLVQQDEWEEYFNSYKTEINQLQDEINTTDKEIDQMVYDLYELAEEEIKIVEESVI
jgi:REP element-mobilizing transposase RayT